MLSKIFKKRTARVAGFTLVEMMIVVFIIALLSTAAVGGYNRYRKISLLELAADNIVSTIYQARDSTKMGSTVGVAEGASSMCYGVLFDMNNKPFVSKVSSKFNAVKEWENGKWVDGLCESAGDGVAIDLDNLVVIEKISVDGVDAPVECSILFAPPEGEISTTCADIGEELSIFINYGEEADESYKRTIKFDLKSGIANVENP